MRKFAPASVRGTLSRIGEGQAPLNVIRVQRNEDARRERWPEAAWSAPVYEATMSTDRVSQEWAGSSRVELTHLPKLLRVVRDT